jgi:NAD(P)-dependent dehydrogenase (short-subunit alcohol dehydrogenase family)
MDLGIAGRWALVGGASKGLGFGCAQALANEGVNLVIVARSAEPLGLAAEKLKTQAQAAGRRLRSSQLLPTSPRPKDVPQYLPNAKTSTSW